MQRGHQINHFNDEFNVNLESFNHERHHNNTIQYQKELVGINKHILVHFNNKCDNMTKVNLKDKYRMYESYLPRN